VAPRSKAQGGPAKDQIHHLVDTSSLGSRPAGCVSRKSDWETALAYMPLATEASDCYSRMACRHGFNLVEKCDQSLP